MLGGDILESLYTPHSPAAGPTLTRLLNEIAKSAPDAEAGDPFVLILDDYHLIEAQPVHEAVTFLVDHHPRQMHLVIATRADPPLPLARMRGRAQLLELRATDLRFSDSEAQEFLNQVMRLNLSSADTAALAARTEGWIAGLQMAAVSMQGREDIPGFIQSFAGSHRHVMDYLIEEVLDCQPQHVQDFLLQTSILDRLTGSLCDRVTGQHNSHFALVDLERANLFVMCLDDESTWYRYHQLFADLLRQRLLRNYPDLLQELHLRASRWYEESGFTGDAVAHALSARDFDRAAVLISQTLGETLWKQGRQTTIMHWLEALPDDIVHSRPRLCVFRAITLVMAGQHEQAETSLKIAERALETSRYSGEADEPDDRNHADQAGMIAAVRAYMAYFQRNPAASITHAQRALTLIRPQNTMWLIGAAIALGDAFSISDDIRSAQQAYAEALQTSRAERDGFLILLAGTKLAVAHAQLGHLRRTDRVCQELLQMAAENGQPQAEITGRVLAVWGNLLCEWDELERAESRLREAVALSQREGNVAALGLSYLYLLRILLARQDFARIDATLYKLDRLTEESTLPAWVTDGIVAWKSLVWTAQGDLAAAAQILDDNKIETNIEPGHGNEGKCLALTRLLMAQDRPAEASTLLSRLYTAAEMKSQLGWMIISLSARAVAFEAQGLRDEAMADLQQALTLGEPEAYIRTFVEAGPPMALLVHEAAARGIAPRYTRRLLAAFAASPAAPHDRPESTPDLLEPLSDRELEVLHMVAEGLSNQEIAARLYLSLRTVKFHTGNIYGKLGVTHRTEAVARARSLGLLPL